MLVRFRELKSDAAKGDIVRAGDMVLAGDKLRGLPSLLGVSDRPGSCLYSICFLGHCPKRD